MTAIATEPFESTATGEEALSIMRGWERSILDEYHRSLPLMKYPPPTSRYALLAQNDLMVVAEFMLAMKNGGRPPEINTEQSQILKGCSEGLSRGFQWLLAQDSSVLVHVTSDRACIESAADYCIHASHYVDIADFHKAVPRLYDVLVNVPKRLVRFVPKRNPSTTSPITPMFESVWERNRLNRSLLAKAAVQRPRSGIVEVTLREGRIWFDKPMQGMTAHSDGVHAQLVALDLPQLPSSTKLGNTTLADCDLVWRALGAWSSAAITVFLEHWTRHYAQNECCPTQVDSLGRVVSSVARWTGLDPGVVESVLALYTLSPKHKADISITPLLVCDDMIAWSPKAVLNSRHRRNLLKAAAQRGMSDEVGTALEPLGEYVADRLARRLEKSRYQCKLRTSYEVGSLRGDIDLLGWTNEARGELLLVEAKGCLPPDEVNEIKGLSDAARTGQEQLRRAVQALGSADAATKRRLFPFVPWSEVRSIRGVVVLFDGGVDSEYRHDELPAVALSVLLDRVPGSAFRTPSRLWYACKEKAWLRSLAAYEPVYGIRSVGDITYHLPMLAK